MAIVSHDRRVNFPRVERKGLRLVCAVREREVKIARDKIDETSCLISFSRVCVISPKASLSLVYMGASRGMKND